MAQKQDSVSKNPSQDPAPLEGDRSVDELERQSELVRRLIEACERSAETSEDLPLSISDIARLIQLQRLAERERPVDAIEVRWIDSKLENEP